MIILNEAQIDGPAAKWLRDRAGLSQKAFWGAYGVQQPGGWRYERGTRIPFAVRRLIFIEHVAGLKLDASTDQGAAEILRIGQMVAAGEHVKQAERLLAAIKH
jgi:hypothetical protein